MARKSKSSSAPHPATLQTLANEARDCKNCDLYKNATQTVFGEGPPSARIMLVGEQPGRREDLAVKPFVGPAGKLMNDVLAEAGTDRARVHVTNAVKHFKWEPRGKRRIHKKPSAAEVAACRSWLESEIAALHPKVIVLLGATAAQSLLGKKFRVTQSHGEFVPSPYAEYAMATVHPSAILRAPTSEMRSDLRQQLLSDLKKIGKLKI